MPDVRRLRDKLWAEYEQMIGTVHNVGLRVPAAGPQTGSPRPLPEQRAGIGALALRVV